jgi:ABC-type transport system involved in multi-copper enzyme maturation permease subunit
VSALLALALDVVLLAARRKTLWLCGIVSTLVVAAIVLPADIHVERRLPLPRADEPGGARSLQIPGSFVAGSVRVEPVVPVGKPWALVDDEAGKLVVHQGGAIRGHVDRGSPAEVVLDPDVAPVGTAAPPPGSGGVELRVTWRESLTTASDRRALLADATGTGLSLAGMEVTFDERETARLGGRVAARQHLLIYLWQLLVYVFAASVGVAVGVFLTADAVPSALEPGAAEVLLSRPIARPTIVLGRYLGALLFGAIQALWLVGLAVAVGGLKLGLWVPELLLCLGPLLLKLALLVAIATLVATALRVQALGLVAAALAWAGSVVVNLLWLNAREMAAEGPTDGLARFLPELTWARQLLPQVSHTDAVAGLLLGVDADIPGFQPWAIVGQDAVWILVCLGLTCLIVSRREY